MTTKERNRDSSIMSVVMPSLKYCCSGSLLMLVKGRTASEGLSGKGSARVSSDGEIGCAGAFEVPPLNKTA